MNEPRFYGRLVLTPFVMEQIKAARSVTVGGSAKHDTEAGTVECKARDGRVMFRAIQKGENARAWIGMFSPHFYPRDQQDEADAMIAEVESNAARDPHCGFYLHNNAGQAIGANGQPVDVSAPLALVALPKFRTWQTLRVFVRWAKPGPLFVPGSMMRGS